MDTVKGLFDGSRNAWMASSGVERSLAGVVGLALAGADGSLSFATVAEGPADPTPRGVSSMPNVVLHTPDKIFSFRHAPSWLALTFAAGCTNATAFMACERFVTHVTGTVTRVGMGVARFALFMDFVIVVTCFLAGAMMAAIMINGRAHRNRSPFHRLPLLLVIVATCVIALVGHAGLLGAFGGEVDELGDFVLLSVLSFASGLQNAAVATSTGLLVRTTHLTGPMTDLGIHLIELAYAQGEERRSAARHALLRGGKVVAFAGGAAVGYLASPSLGYLTLLFSAGSILLAVALSFRPQQRPSEPARPAEASSAAKLPQSPQLAGGS